MEHHLAVEPERTTEPLEPVEGPGSALARPRLLVLGGAADLRAKLGDERFLLQTLKAPEHASKLEWLVPDAVVLDESCFPVEEALHLRSTRLRRVPFLVIERSPGEGLALDAEDSLTRPLDAAKLHRRLHLLVELGRSRRALALAERARDRARAALDERQQFTSEVLEGIHSAIITTDARGRVTFANRVAVSTLRLSVEQCLGQRVVTLLQLPPEAYGRFFVEQQDGRTSDPEGAPVTCEKRFSYSLRRPDGSDVELGLSISRARGPAHHRLGYYVVFRDLAPTRQLEVDVRRVERLAAMGTMVAGFAHEVRNPVASMRILGEALEAELDRSDPHHEYISRMMRQLERIERLVKTSLQFGRPESPMRGVHRPAAIAAAANEAILPRTTEKRGSIRVEIEPDLPTIYVDDAQIVQVLVIFLNNALDAAGQPEKVTLRVRSNWAQGKSEGAPTCAGDEVRFEVIDEGPGIPAYMLGHVFDPFFTTKPNGTGLGLSIAQQLVHENRGRIEISSTLEQGTTVAVLVRQSQGPT